MIRKLLIMLVLLCTCLVVGAQIMVKGKVLGSEDMALSHITVKLNSKQGTWQTKTDTSGLFILKIPTAGKYRMLVSGVGYERLSTEILCAQDTNDLGILVLQNSDNTLQTVEVLGEKSRKYFAAYSFAATKVAAFNKDIPQAISTVSKELIQDRQATTVTEALKSVSGVTNTSFYNHFAIRGITQNEEGVILNGMRTRQSYFVVPLTTNLERIEVIKGPASATFSSVDPGGSINLVTKKPLMEDRKQISIMASSFSTIRAALDFTGPMNVDKTLLYRLNVGYEDAKSFRELQFRKALQIAPSFSFVPNDRTRLNVEMVLNNNNTRLDRGQAIFGAIPGVTSLTTTPISFAMGNLDDYYKTSDAMLMANFSRKISNSLNWNATYMKQTWEEDLYENRTSNAFALDADGNSIPTLAAMRAVRRIQRWNNDNFSTYMNWDVKKTQFENQLMLGYDVILNQKNRGSSQTANRYLRKDGTTANFKKGSDTTQFQMRNYTVSYAGETRVLRAPVPNVPHFDLANPLYILSNEKTYNYASSTISPAYYAIHALYIQDQFKWKRWHLILGLRQEWYKDIANYKQQNAFEQQYHKLLPRVGMTYEINSHINAYATYLEGYQPQSNTSSLMLNPPSDNTVFKPLVSNLKELGLKSAWLNQRFIVNVAAYEINQKNILVNANESDNVDLLVQRGAERSRGIELEAIGALSSRWNINFSYSYIDAKIVKDTNIELIGSRTANTPIHAGSVWTKYDLPDFSFLKGVGIGAGLQYSGSKIPWYTRAFTLPGYTVADLALYYRPSLSKIQLQLNVNNVLNKTYWTGAMDYNRLYPGVPRNMMLNVTYKF